MPRVVARGRSTYLLLSGLRVPRRVPLASGIELLPIDEAAGPRPYLSGLELLDQQFALLALPWVQAQLKVSALPDSKIGIRAWNALWDVLLLSAIYAVPVNCGLQSTTAFERFTEKSRLNVIHYRVFDPPEGDGYALSEQGLRLARKELCSGPGSARGTSVPDCGALHSDVPLAHPASRTAGSIVGRNRRAVWS